VRISARIDIRNAIIHGPLRLKYADFRKEFLFLGCEVTERADFSYSVFHHNLVLSGTTFRKGADFRAASLAYDARLKRCKFLSGSARFDDLHVNGNFLAHGVRFGEGVKACFERARFDKYAIFRSGVFGGDAMFTDVEFGSDAEFDDAQFRRDAGFDSTRIKGTGHFSRSNFDGDANFTGLEIASDLQFDEARFSCAKSHVSFELAHIQADAHFEHVVFGRWASFSGARIDGDAFFSSDSQNEEHSAPSRFQDEASFLNVQIGGDADFEKVLFEKSVEFVGARIGGGAIFREAKFLRSSKSRFDLTQFQGGAYFEGCIFEDDIHFRGARFEVAARFSGAEFEGTTDFEASEFSGLAEFKNGKWEKRSFPGAVFGQVSFAHARFRQDARFDDVKFRSGADFRETSFRVVYFKDVDSASKVLDGLFEGKLDLRGCTYERIYVSWQLLLQHMAPYDRQPYVQLEKVLQAMGRDEEALDVYLARRKIERLNKWKRLSARGQEWRKRLENGLTYAGDVIYWRAANYGVRPYRLLVSAAILLAWGMVLFSRPNAVHLTTLSHPPNAEATSAKEGGSCSAPLGLLDASRVSLRTFLPVDIPVLTDCEPSDRYWLRLRFSDWAAILKLAGWVVVPIGIAALSGLLRRTAP
jgi:hypothetical protein